MPLPRDSRREGERTARLSPETGLQPASRSLAIWDFVSGLPRFTVVRGCTAYCGATPCPCVAIATRERA
jgi:hypothetical protein